MARLAAFTTAGSGTAWEDTTVDVGVGEEAIVQNISGTATDIVGVALSDSTPATGVAGIRLRNSAGNTVSVTLRGPGNLYARNATGTAIVISIVVQAAQGTGT